MARWLEASPARLPAWSILPGIMAACPLAISLQPAIRLARDGFPVDEKYHAMMGYRIEAIKRWPAAAKVLLADGEVPPLGLHHQAAGPGLGFWSRSLSVELKASIPAPSQNGWSRGSVMPAGIWTMDDLAAYKMKEREPIRTQYGDYELVTAPPPSSGGIAIAEMLNILEAYPINQLGTVQRSAPDGGGYAPCLSRPCHLPG